LNFAAIVHQTGSADVCSLDARTVVLRLAAARGDVLSARVVYAQKFHWHEESHKQTQSMRLIHSSAQRDWFSAELHLTDDRLAYIFRLDTADGEYWLSEKGITRAYAPEDGYFNFFQVPAIHQEDIARVPSWLPGTTCYQIFPERFDGDVAGKAYVNLPWGDSPSPSSWAGGDLHGILRRLAYLEDLGVSCLYLTPVFTSGSNHKYDTMDYYQVDARFGGNGALKALIDQAHSRGIRVLLDGVFNHCSDAHPFFEDVRRHGKASPYHGWFYIDGDKPDALGASKRKRNYRTFAEVSYMPRLNSENPDVIHYFCDVGRYWIREFGADGWRLDVCDELSHTFLRAFRKAVKAAKPEALILGEIWHHPFPWLTDQLDGAMNYGLTKALLDLLAFELIDAAEFADRLVYLLMRSSDPHNAMMMNLIGTHDTHRFLTRVNGDVRRLMAAYSVLFFYPGFPSVYYGDEIGMAGGFDPGCRGCFDWDASRWNTQLRDHVKRLILLKRSPALANGTFSVEAKGPVIIMMRQYGDDVKTLALNTASEPAEYRGKVLPPFGSTIHDTTNP